MKKVVLIFAILTTGYIAHAQDFIKPSAPNPYDTINGNLVEKHVLLLWIQPQFADSVNINDTNRVVRPFVDFVRNDFLDSIPNVILKDFTRANAFKIFPQLTENDTVSLSRGGRNVVIPPFYTALHVYFSDTSSNIVQIFDSLVNRVSLIRGIEYNCLMEYSYAPDDPFYCQAQKSLHNTYFDSITMQSCNGSDCNINAARAWQYSVGEKYIRVGIHDTGIKWDHEDFYFSTGLPKITEGFNYGDPGVSCHDYAGHGTMMADIIGAVTNNSTGIARIAGGNDPKVFGASIIDMTLGAAPFVSVFYNSVVSGANSTNVSGGMGLHIMNFSIGWSEELPLTYPYDFSLMKECIQFAYKNEVTMVCAAGNLAPSPKDSIVYPACFRNDWVINVGGIYTSSSNILFGYGAATKQYLDFVAPGGNYNPGNLLAYTTTYDNTLYDWVGETSSATAHASGSAALLLSYYNDSLPLPSNLSPEDVEHILEIGTMDNYAWSNNWYDLYSFTNQYLVTGAYVSWGRLNAFYSLRRIDPAYSYFKHIDTSFVLAQGDLSPAQNYSALRSSENFNGFNSSSIYSNADVYSLEVQFALPQLYNVEIDTVWIRNSSSNLWGQPFQSLTNWYFTPEDSVMLTYFDGQTAKFQGYVYDLNNHYYPVQIGDTVHISISVYGHRTDAMGFDEENIEPTLHIYPNPANEGVNIEIDPAFGQCTIELFDMKGCLISTINSNGELKQFINTRDLPESLYILRVHNAEISLIKKLIVSH